MKIYQNMTRELVEHWFSGAGWVLSPEHGDFTGNPVGFHYHDVEEWLQVTNGKVTFVSAGGMKYLLDAGDVLQIPRGEVHDVEIGPDGVDYQMWVPVAVPEQKWETKLTDEDMNLIRMNLAVPEHEDSGDAPFFDAMLSDRLMFYGVDGTVLDKKGFFGRGFVRRGRSTYGSVRVLNHAGQPASFDGRDGGWRGRDAAVLHERAALRPRGERVEVSRLGELSGAWVVRNRSNSSVGFRQDSKSGFMPNQALHLTGAALLFPATSSSCSGPGR